jgi:6-pyruvoyltetrahydropterin/6-carboxytetrahydropterin synthase
MKFHLVKQLVFEAAHRNPGGGEAQQRLHGHSYAMDVLACGEVNPDIGWIVDFGELKHRIGPLYDQLDHAYLNDLPDMPEGATLPGVTAWINARLEPRPVWLDGVRLRIVGDLAFKPLRLEADPFAGLPARVHFTFEAAQSLPQLPGNHPCKCIHGHSYRMEVGAADLEELLPHLETFHGMLDHRYLNEVPGFERATVEHMCAETWRWLESRGAVPTVVVVQETPTSRCVYLGE